MMPPNEVEDMRLQHLRELQDDMPEAEFVEYIKGFQPPDSLGYHELRHMAAVVGKIFDMEVLQHPACILDRELFRQAYAIGDMLCAFYHYQKVSTRGEDTDVRS